VLHRYVGQVSGNSVHYLLAAWAKVVDNLPSLMIKRQEVPQFVGEHMPKVS